MFREGFHVFAAETCCKFDMHYIQLQGGRLVLSHVHVNRDDGHILLKLHHVCCCFRLNERVSDCV